MPPSFLTLALSSSWADPLHMSGYSESTSLGVSTLTELASVSPLSAEPSPVPLEDSSSSSSNGVLESAEPVIRYLLTFGFDLADLTDEEREWPGELS